VLHAVDLLEAHRGERDLVGLLERIGHHGVEEGLELGIVVRDAGVG